jgi:predicted RNA-binding Zn ribbon-like protein
VRLRKLREALYELLRLRVGAEPTADVDDHVGVVNDFARKSSPAMALQIVDNTRLVSAATEFTAAHALALLARDGIDVLTGPDAHRLRQCEADPCGTFFFDSARGPHRRWCSSEMCGNRVRVSAYRARQTT